MSERPLVSVVMPVRNEAGFIARALRAVLAQEWPEDTRRLGPMIRPPPE